MPVLLLFDIDGTILKLKEGISRSIFKNALRQTFGIEIEDEHLPGFAGKTDLQILKEIIVQFGIEYNFSENNINNFWKIIYDSFEKYCIPSNMILMPGIRELLQDLSSNRNFTLGLLTGNLKVNAYLKLRVFELDKYFPFGSFGSDNDDRNMLPAIAIKRANEYIFNNPQSYFFKTVEKTFDKTNTIIIGDSPNDIECANTNGIFSLAVATGPFNSNELRKYHPSLIVENFSDYNYVVTYILEKYKNN